MPRHTDLTGTYPYADVVRRSVRCHMACDAPAIYDVSLRNRQGAAGEWLSLCQTHAAQAITQRHVKANAEGWPQPVGTYDEVPGDAPTDGGTR